MPNLRDLTRALGMLVAALSLALLPQPARAAHHEDAGIVALERSYVDKTRGIKASMGFAGSDTRRIDVKVWRPARPGDGPLPLIIYSHGTFGFADNAMHFVRALVREGYVVAAPDYPLSSRNAHTKIKFADISDVAQQVKDVSFLIDSLLADPKLGKLIDADSIGITGHSLGGVTSYFATYGQGIRDPRIVATAPIGAGDPVQTALSGDMGLWGTWHAAVPVPVLFLTAEHDVFSRTTGQPGAALARVESPKYELIVAGGSHVWFRDGDDRHPQGKNPDCLFFEANMPKVTMPGCEGPVALTTAARQQEITRIALVAFFNAFLKEDPAALERLRGLGEEFADAELVHEER